MDRTLEILTPYQEIDNNIGGGSAGFISNPTEQTVVALCEDELYEELMRVESALHRLSVFIYVNEVDKHSEITLDWFLNAFERNLR